MVKKCVSFSVVGITGIEFESGKSSSLEIIPGIFLTNSEKHIRSLISNTMVRLAGLLEVNYLATCKAVFYEVNEISTDVPKHYDNVPDLVSFVDKIGLILVAFWLIKDYSASFDLAFNEFPHLGVNSRVSSNGRANSYCYKSDGSKTKTVFSKNEMDLVQRIFFGCDKSMIPQPDYFKSGFEKGVTRWEKALYFINNARKNINLALRIAEYCTALECLFSSDNAELSHKLSERVAFFIGTSPQERSETYRMVKEAYAIRSKVYHGDFISDQNKIRLPSISTWLDDCLRKIILKVFSAESIHSIFSGKKECFEEYFTALQFGDVKSA